MNSKLWTPGSWRQQPISQAPVYPDMNALEAVESRLSRYPSLVFEAEVDQLRSELAAVGQGEAFLLQGGDCAETFADFRLETIRDNFRILLQMAIVLTFGSKRRVVKVGRVAGQFAKPRSSNIEEKDGVSLPAYRGDIINGHEFTSEARTPDPARIEQAYFHSAATLNLLRSLSKGGFADLHRIQGWNLEFVRDSKFGDFYDQVAVRLEEALDFMNAVGIRGDAIETTEIFTSHESLLLNYEEALVRQTESASGTFYASSAHMIWIGERTRQLDGAHVEFARGITNPIGLKCGPEMKKDDLLRLIDRLNPTNIPGRLTIISRMGIDKIEGALAPLAQAVKQEGRQVVWCCDPMHGNTYGTASGYKTRSFDSILGETKSFFDVHHAEGTVAGGVHFELTGRDVIECTGGSQKIIEEQLTAERYESRCDPRLNASQALEFAFAMMSMSAKRKPAAAKK